MKAEQNYKGRISGPENDFGYRIGIDILVGFYQISLHLLQFLSHFGRLSILSLSF